MKQSIQNKINKIKAASKMAKRSAHVVNTRACRIVNDNLSKALRSEKDVLVFQEELENAVNKARTAAVVVGQ